MTDIRAKISREMAGEPGQIVLVLQGGGALGAYQAGVYEAMHESGLEPDWVIGTSIGAFNAALIAGNPRERRLDRLREFWTSIGYGPIATAIDAMPWVGPMIARAFTATAGMPAFFSPNAIAGWGPFAGLGPERAAFYDVDGLRTSLTRLTEPALLASGAPRLTIGAASVASGSMRYFDSRADAIGVEHILASGALPPAFPAVRIDGDLYWDGGILSNTPIEAVLDDEPRRDSLVFSVHVWNPEGAEPDTIWKVIGRQKEIQYASRSASHIMRQRQLHRLRHVIADLSAYLPDDLRQRPEVRELEDFGCTTRMHVVLLTAPSLTVDDHTKDIDFSPGTIATRWRAGLRATRRILEKKPWAGSFDPREGMILHEPADGAGSP